ncbi:MAG TPA: serine/threonine-protein kinase, partial [Abditibacteriaceae bacterium]
MQIGERIGPYEIREQLGEGGMAQVFKAWHTGLHRFEALKIPTPRGGHLRDDRAFINRFVNEARTVAGLRHAHIATIYGVSDPEASQAYFAMEWVEGEDLSKLLSARGRLSVDETLAILEPVAQALDYAHSRGIIHRDIKPANVLLEAKSNSWHPKVVDFGIARAAQSEVNQTRLTQAGAIVGTPEYMSPEQSGSGAEVDYRSDIYSLGVVTYEMLCGRPPFFAVQGGSPLSVLVQHVRDVPPLPTSLRNDLPAPLNDVLLWALAKAPTERPQSCAAMVAALQKAWDEFKRPVAEPVREPVTISDVAQPHSTRELSQQDGTPTVFPPSTKPKFPLAVPLMLVMLCAGFLMVGAALLRGPGGPATGATPTHQPTVAPPVLPKPDPKVAQAAALAEEANALLDDGEVKWEKMFSQVKSGKMSRNEALIMDKEIKRQFARARDKAKRGVSLHDRNEEAWRAKCRAHYKLTECETFDCLSKAIGFFPRNSKLKLLNEFAQKNIPRN